MKPNVTPGTVVLITGCSSGLGLLMDETLARKKYHVFATMRAVDDRNAKTARELRTLAESESLQLDVLELDVTDNASVKRSLYVLSVATTPSAWKRTSALSHNSERVRTALGFHPHLAHKRRSERGCHSVPGHFLQTARNPRMVYHSSY